MGSFEVSGGAEALMEGRFRYNVAEWEPTIEYEELGTKGLLTIAQKDVKGKSIPEDAENHWVIRLNGSVPLTIRLDAGIGDASLELADLTVDKLMVNQGIGAAVVNLGHELDRDVEIEVEGGVGDITIVVPDDIGARVRAEMGIGSLSVQGFKASGDDYVNALYGKTEHTVEIRISAGVGSVTIKPAGGTATV
jgi:predicted membrane protein